MRGGHSPGNGLLSSSALNCCSSPAPLAIRLTWWWHNMQIIPGNHRINSSVNLRSSSVQPFLAQTCKENLILSNTVKRLVSGINSILLVEFAWVNTKAIHGEIIYPFPAWWLENLCLSETKIHVMHSSWWVFHVPLPCQGVRRMLREHSSVLTCS